MLATSALPHSSISDLLNYASCTKDRSEQDDSEKAEHSHVAVAAHRRANPRVYRDCRRKYRQPASTVAPKIVLDDVLRSHQSHAWAMRQIEKLVGTDKMAVLEFACTAVLAIALFDAVCTYAEKYLTTSVAQTGGWRRKK